MIDSQPRPREAWRSTVRGLSQLESELAKLEQALALAQAEGESDLPARTSVLNLVVYARDAATLSSAATAVSQLAGRSPSRTIYVRPTGSVKDGIEAELRATCLAGTETLPQVCVEEIWLQAGGLRPENLPELLAPLRIADLPVFAWYPAPGDDPPEVLDGLAELADHLVIDSATLGQNRALLRRLVEHAPKVVDFNWLRLLPWAELVAQFFDPEPSRRYLEQVTMLQVEYVSPSSFGAVLLTGWLANRLGWAPFSEDRAPLVRFFRASGEPGQYALTQLFPANHETLPSGSLLGLVAQAERRAGTPARFQIRRGQTGTSVQTLARLPNGRQIGRTAPLPPDDPSSLLAEALDQLEPSPVYQNALETAVRLVT